MQVGVDSAAQPATYLTNWRLTNFVVRRAPGTVLGNPASGVSAAAAIGVAFRWCALGDCTGVEALGHLVGFYFYGTVENYWTRLRALRGARMRAAHPGNDYFIGFWLDYSAPLSANGRNASSYFESCAAFGRLAGQGDFHGAYGAGLRTSDGFVDLYVNNFETGTLEFGIDMDGGGGAGADYRTEDAKISNCVLDSASLAGIRIRNADSSCAVTVSGAYVNATAGGHAVWLEKLGGMVALVGNQFNFLAANAGGAILATDVNGLTSEGNLMLAPALGYDLTRVRGFVLRDNLRLLTAAGHASSNPAARLAGCSHGKVDCVIGGDAGAASPAAVELSGCDYVEVSATAILDAIATSAKVFCDGAPVTAAGAFGAANLLAGTL